MSVHRSSREVLLLLLFIKHGSDLLFFFFPFFQCVSVSVSTFTPWWQYMHMYTTKQQYGGPFGPDPYYIYGQKSAAQGLYGFSSMGH